MCVWGGGGGEGAKIMYFTIIKIACVSAYHKVDWFCFSNVGFCLCHREKTSLILLNEVEMID